MRGLTDVGYQMMVFGGGAVDKQLETINYLLCLDGFGVVAVWGWGWWLRGRVVWCVSDREVVQKLNYGPG